MGFPFDLPFIGINGIAPFVGVGENPYSAVKRDPQFDPANGVVLAGNPGLAAEALAAQGIRPGDLPQLDFGNYQMPGGAPAMRPPSQMVPQAGGVAQGAPLSELMQNFAGVKTPEAPQAPQLPQAGSPPSPGQPSIRAYSQESPIAALLLQLTGQRPQAAGVNPLTKFVGG